MDRPVAAFAATDTEPAVHADDPLWYKDAVVYQLHVRAFHDSDADGIGDFRGLTQKLDYIQDLGANTIWLLPFYPSPLKDDAMLRLGFCQVQLKQYADALGRAEQYRRRGKVLFVFGA